jgi:hypothetical protein
MNWCATCNWVSKPTLLKCGFCVATNLCLKTSANDGCLFVQDLVYIKSTFQAPDIKTNTTK